MNSSRHANRSNRGQSSWRGRGRGGRARGSFRDRDNNLTDMKSLPNVQQVVPGAPVSIVLKIDQPTGNEVQGIVAELLTRGDHPRGIKVRLQDGRVGRVQRMVSEETATVGSGGLSELGRNGEVPVEGGVGVRTRSGSTGGLSVRRYGDFRNDDPDEPPNAGLSLANYVVMKAKGKGRQKKHNASDSEGDFANDEITTFLPKAPTITIKCPVCGEFEGDETAVAHHVNEHFE